ncbi:MAG: hypothetical protein CMB96_06220 [Flavobacteriaceae bacterium]|nr:hypothetical protein [Flavobacteriaceae bacterium]
MQFYSQNNSPDGTSSATETTVHFDDTLPNTALFGPSYDRPYVGSADFIMHAKIAVRWTKKSYRVSDYEWFIATVTGYKPITQRLVVKYNIADRVEYINPKTSHFVVLSDFDNDAYERSVLLQRSEPETMLGGDIPMALPVDLNHIAAHPPVPAPVPAPAPAPAPVPPAHEAETERADEAETEKPSKLDIANLQCARGNIVASLYAIQLYLKKTKHISLSSQGWVPPSEASHVDKMFYGSCVNADAMFIIDEMLKEQGIVCGFQHKPEDKMLAVAVADTPEPIIAETAKWPKFKLDEAGFRTAMSGPNSFAAAVRWHAHFTEGWLQDTGFDAISTKYDGDRIQLTKNPGNCITVCDDVFKLPTGSYIIQSARFIYTVRITDVTGMHLNTQTPVITYDEILDAHASQEEWVHDRKYKGFRFNSFKIDVTPSVQSILGVENGDVKIVAAQAGGIVQINKATPLNADVSTVCVPRYRSFSKDNIPPGVYVDFTHQDRGKFINLCEIFVAHKSAPRKRIRMYDGLFDQDSTVGSDN